VNNVVHVALLIKLSKFFPRSVVIIIIIITIIIIINDIYI